MEKGMLIVVSGFSGAGKGTLIRELMKKHDNYSLSISATTRKPRPGETDGQDYFFLTKEQFENLIRLDALIEYAAYVGNYYGTPRDYVNTQLDEGKNVILEIEIQGALKVKKKFPETMLIFVTPPDAETLKARMTGRGTESEKEIAARLHRAAEESRWMDGYDYILVNDKLEDAAEELHSLITAQHHRTEYNMDFVKRIQEDLNEHFLKED